MTLRIAYVTTCRSDYGPAAFLLRDLEADPRFELRLWVAGAHLTLGTVQEIVSDGCPIAAELAFDTQNHARGAAQALEKTALLLAAEQPDLLLLYGDRHELLPLANAALLAGTPIAHLCGGDVTLGAFDEQVRHALTKLAHLHFASSARSAARIRQMGEEPWRVHDVGDPSLDHFRRGERARAEELAAVLGFVPDLRSLLVTWHPTTLALGDLQADTQALLHALASHPGGIVFTAPAPDPGSDEIRRALQTFVAGHPRSVFVESLGSRRYRGLLALCGAMVGNSSSGLSEAPCVPLPVVNVGDRQAGRDRARNVIDVPAETSAIQHAIESALSPAFRAALAGLESPYGDGRSSTRIVEILARLPDRATLLSKRFVEMPSLQAQAPHAALQAEEPKTAPGAGSVSSDHPVKAVGGDFALASEFLFGEAGAQLFASGRDALAAIVAAHPSDGRPWLLPEFFCPVVPETLRAAGFTVLPYPCITPWQPDLDALGALLDGAAGIVLHHHLGLPPDESVWQVLAGRSLLVVEDRCQVVGMPAGAAALRGDFAIGSYRKWAPVPDGGYCLGRQDQRHPSSERANDMVRLRVAAGLAKAAHGRGEASVDAGVEGAYVTLFRAGELAAGAPAKPRRGSSLTAELLATLDIDALKSARLYNQRYLAHALVGTRRVQLFEPEPGAIAKTQAPLLALPLMAADRDALRAELVEASVFAPVHWVDGDWAQRGGQAASWAAQTLSIPIDARVGEAELRRLVRLLS
jgi:UDP-hydrolysing UDP-N-acetyl-D-glucosamine 2-epimerase